MEPFLITTAQEAFDLCAKFYPNGIEIEVDINPNNLPN